MPRLPPAREDLEDLEDAVDLDDAEESDDPVLLLLLPERSEPVDDGDRDALCGRRLPCCLPLAGAAISLGGFSSLS